jgi:ABC-type nitrate/sulfonate/bicarbonate transport system permease component
MPSIAPEANGLRIAHGFVRILIVVGEMTGVPTGPGSVVMDGRTLSRTDLVITMMIVIGACGLISDSIIVAISNRLLSWSATGCGKIDTAPHQEPTTGGIPIDERAIMGPGSEPRRGT